MLLFENDMQQIWVHASVVQQCSKYADVTDFPFISRL